MKYTKTISVEQSVASSRHVEVYVEEDQAAEIRNYLLKEFDKVGLRRHVEVTWRSVTGYLLVALPKYIETQPNDLYEFVQERIDEFLVKQKLLEDDVLIERLEDNLRFEINLWIIDSMLQQMRMTTELSKRVVEGVEDWREAKKANAQ